MAAKTFRPWDVDQQMLFPPSVKDFVSPEGPYRLRKQVVEPVFGQIKAARGFRQFLYRGLERVSAEWSMLCTAHNILKLAAARFAAVE